MTRPSYFPQRRFSVARALNYAFQRFVLRRPFLLAGVPDLDLRFRIKTEDVVGRHLYKYQVHEPLLSQFLARNLEFEPDDVLIDIGGNVGWYSLLLHRLAPPDVDILTFEPDDMNFRLLSENLSLNGADNVHPQQLAVSDVDGVQTLHRYGNSNLGRHSMLQLQDGEAVDVPTTTLDSFWTAQGLGDRVPRLIKIDVEGYELVALRGAESVLARCPAVLSEYSPPYMRTGGLDPAEYVELMTGHGFQPSYIRKGGLTPADPKTLPQFEGITDLFWQKPGTP